MRLIPVLRAAPHLLEQGTRAMCIYHELGVVAYFFLLPRPVIYWEKVSSSDRSSR